MIKTCTLLFIGVLVAHGSYAQQTELSVQFNAGFAAYRGSSTSSTTLIERPEGGSGPFAANAYGSQPTLSYGVSLQAQRIIAGHNLVGLQAGLEQLNSRVPITAVLEREGQTVPADGRSTLSNTLLNAHAFFGHRFTLGAVALDLTAGPEAGFSRRSQEKVVVISASSRRYNASLGHSHPTADVRARLNLTAYYKLTGFSIGYSHGLTNYRAAGDPVTEKLAVQVLRMGLSYRLAL